MATIMPAGKGIVEIAPGKHTWLEAIHRNNLAHRRMVPNPFHTFHPAEGGPDPFSFVKQEIAEPIYTGTAGVIENNGKPLGKFVRCYCDYNGSRKAVIYEPTPDQMNLVGTAVLCLHGFAQDGTPSIQLFDARTGKPIATDEDMLLATEVLMKFNGETYLLPAPDHRWMAWTPATPTECTTCSQFPYFKAMGLVIRHLFWLRRFWDDFSLRDKPSDAFEVLVESGGSPTDARHQRMAVEAKPDGVE